MKGFIGLTCALAFTAMFMTNGFAADQDQATIEKSMQRFYDEVASQGKFDAINELVAEGFVTHMPLQGYDQNREGLREFFMAMREAFPDLKCTVDMLIVKGDKGVALITMSGTQKGEFMGMPASGKQFSTQGIDIVRFENGKAVEHWGVSDDMTMMHQLGMMGEPMEGDETSSKE